MACFCQTASVKCPFFNLNLDHVGLYDVDPVRLPVKRGKYRSVAGLFLHLKNLGKKNE